MGFLAHKSRFRKGTRTPSWRPEPLNSARYLFDLHWFTVASWEPTYPLKNPFRWDMLVPWRVTQINSLKQILLKVHWPGKHWASMPSNFVHCSDVATKSSTKHSWQQRAQSWCSHWCVSISWEFPQEIHEIDIKQWQIHCESTCWYTDIVLYKGPLDEKNTGQQVTTKGTHLK